MDYDFLVLDNAFLVHKPGIKVLAKNRNVINNTIVQKQADYIKKIIMPELLANFGKRNGCVGTI